MNKFMKMALIAGEQGYKSGDGGPFGAVIVLDDEVLAVAHNRVIKDNDPTAHAEILAIREACKKLGSYHLDNAVIYATGQPCPMCLAAIIWANIKICYYGNSHADIKLLGPRNDMVYQYFASPDQAIIKLEQLDREDCIGIYRDYAKLNKQNNK